MTLPIVEIGLTTMRIFPIISEYALHIALLTDKSPIIGTPTSRAQAGFKTGAKDKGLTKRPGNPHPYKKTDGLSTTSNLRYLNKSRSYALQFVVARSLRVRTGDKSPYYKPKPYL